MNKTYLIIAGLIVVVVFLAGFLLFGKQKTTTSSKTETVNTKNLVMYSNSGFLPETLTIKSGETATFKNETSGAMWVASNPHPVHTDFSVFDQKSVGDTYSFSFSSSGTYKYHNHRNPRATGTVIVK